MSRSLEHILQEQELAEQAGYQSPEAIRQMIQSDFSNSAQILQAVETVNLAEFFRNPSALFLHQKIPLPVRTCGFFHGAKHTLSQIPYLHSHNFYEYIYVLRGECMQHLGNQEETLCLYAHQSCLLAPGVSHIMERCRNEDIILKFSVSERIFQETVLPLLSAPVERDLMQPRHAGVCIPFSPAAMERGFAVFEHGNAWTDLYVRRLLQESRAEGRFAQTAVRNYLSLLFIELARASSDRQTKLVTQLETYLEKNPQECSLAQFAAYIGYSADYAGRMIKQVTGRTFGEYLRSRRLMAAAELLAETDYTVEYISAKSGYGTVSGFYKQFCRSYGMAPGEYRKNFSKNQS